MVSGLWLSFSFLPLMVYEVVNFYPLKFKEFRRLPAGKQSFQLAVRRNRTRAFLRLMNSRFFSFLPSFLSLLSQPSVITRAISDDDKRCNINYDTLSTQLPAGR